MGINTWSPSTSTWIVTDSLLPQLRLMGAVLYVSFHAKMMRYGSPPGVDFDLAVSTALVLAMLAFTQLLQQTVLKGYWFRMHPYDGFFGGGILHLLDVHDTLLYFLNSKLLYQIPLYYLCLALTYRMTPFQVLAQTAGFGLITAGKIGVLAARWPIAELEGGGRSVDFEQVRIVAVTFFPGIFINVLASALTEIRHRGMFLRQQKFFTAGTMSAIYKKQN
jgi:hypothetical protein